MVKDFIRKCCILNVVPVLVARRISYIARAELFEPCGIIVHETYNQRYPSTAEDLASNARNKRLLGYHDIRTGNEPDERLTAFFLKNLPKVFPVAAVKFQRYRPLLTAFATGALTYREFWRDLRAQRGLANLPPEYDIEPGENDEG
jgi:hypothetical protein